MRGACLVLALALAACSNPVADAEERYEIASRDFLDPMAKCEAAGDVKKAALEANDAEAYDRWMLTEYNDCAEARRGSN